MAKVTIKGLNVDLSIAELAELIRNMESNGAAAEPSGVQTEIVPKALRRKKYKRGNVGIDPETMQGRVYRAYAEHGDELALADAVLLIGDLTYAQVMNCTYRLAQHGWVEQVAIGVYRVRGNAK
jgi:hypothetical protein